MATRLIDIDGEALRKEIRSRGLTQTEAGRMIYKSESYFAKVIARNKIQKGDVEHIQERFNIAPETYVIPEVSEPEQLVIEAPGSVSDEIVIAPQISAEQWTRLEELITRAVTKAIVNTIR